MKKDFQVGDHMGWNSEAGHVRGTIMKKVTSAIKFKTYTVHASKEEPQYLNIKRQDRPSGHAQGYGAQEAHKQAVSARRMQIADGLKKSTPKEAPSPMVMTIGHSTRTLEEFIDLLQTHGASCVVDVRTVPRSRHNPQFNKAFLPEPLKKAGLGYVHLPGLGGLRHAKPDSLNTGWSNTSFRGYADYMQTPEFAQTLDELVLLANRGLIVLMCAEAVPWRCHRSLIADALLVRGIRAEDIMSLTRRQAHTLTPFAKVQGTAITYPAEVSRSTHKKPPAKRSRTLPVAKAIPEKKV